ncbi:MAG TPA: OmpH family outer membrane protein [Armatimonadota bacterium]|jgi:Skp family chaperone for outer membrane proteins
MKHFGSAMMIAAGLLALGAIAPAGAQSNVTVGYIEMEKVFNGADAKKAGEDKVNNLAKTLTDREGLLKDAAFLPPKTWLEYRGLLEKEKPEGADTTSLTTIKGQITALDTELKTLQQTTPALTDAQKARLNELNGNATANTGNLQQVDADYAAQISKLQLDLRGSIIKEIQTAAAQVMKNKSISVVLNKQAAAGDDGQLLVVAGGVDMTDDVLKQVNANHK